MAYIVVGVPTYNEHMPVWLLPPLVEVAKKHTMQFTPVSSSLLTFAHNLLICAARQMPECDYYLNVHSDMIPEPMALVKLIDEAIRVEADVMSAIIPIKDERGLTSTGFAKTGDKWEPVHRFTMRQIMEMPVTFGQEVLQPDEILMVNTGILLVNMRKPWAKDICFTVEDRIVLDPNNIPTPIVLPEDWGLSRQLYEWGAKVFATRVCQVGHLGRQVYPNHQAWGSWQSDQGDNWRASDDQNRGPAEAVDSGTRGLGDPELGGSPDQDGNHPDQERGAQVGDEGTQAQEELFPRRE